MNLCTCLLFNVIQLCVGVDHIWHSYQHDPNHRSREELEVTNITADDHFKLDYQVIKWKSLRVEKTCYLAGLMARNVAIASITLNGDKNEFKQESHSIDLQERPIDVALFHHWNATLKKSDVVAVVATEKPELLWFTINGTNHSKFWTWPLHKNLSHINIFKIDYDYQLLIISTYLTQTTGDLYEFELKPQPNFWLRQKIRLSEPATTSTLSVVGPDHFLAIPQQSLQVYKLIDGRFESFRNLTSDGITEVVSFNMGHKWFLAINGLNAGIYRFTRNGLVRENLAETNLDGVHYWLPVPVNTYRDETILIAQRSLDHDAHKSFVIEVITYNGDKFEEHDDTPCMYFGENILGLSCLPGEGTERGILGATSICLDDVLGLIIPRENSFSELFMVQTTIKVNPNPIQQQLEGFVEKKRYLDNLMASEEKRYREIVANPQPRNVQSMRAHLKEIDRDVTTITELVNSMKNSTHYSSIVFNGLVEIEGDGVFNQFQVDKIEGEPADAILGDIVLKNNVGAISGPKTFTDLEVEDLFFDQVNKINASDLLFSSDNITINNLLLEKPLVVFKDATVNEVNGLVFEDEVVDLDSSADDLVFETVEIGNATVDRLNHLLIPTKSEDADLEDTELDTLFIPYNIQVTNVNGENFDEFLKQLCLRNIKTYIPGTIRVNGAVTVKGDATIGYLNNLKFPLEYVFRDDTFPNITGNKNFASTLNVSEVKAEGTIDGIHTSRVITLSTDQRVTGTTTFNNLKVAESLEVDGRVIGEHAGKFLPNPTLIESDIVKANVHFKDLEVEGAIILAGDFNERNFNSLMSDIVYRNEKKPTIEAMKQFPEGFTVRTNLLVNSSTINDVHLDSLVTKDTEQVLNLTTLKGIVNFGNVEIFGLYDSIDVRKLDEETVKLEGEQYISSTLVFEEPLEVNDLEILETINGLRQDQFFYTRGNQQFNNTLDFERLSVDSILVEGDVVGKIENFDLADFDRRRMSLTKDQVIDAGYTIDKMEASRVNNVGLKQFTHDSIVEKLTARLKQGRIQIKNLHVGGSVEIDEIDGNAAINLGGSFWKNDVKKYHLTNLSFNDDTYFQQIRIDKLSGVNFTRYLNNMVFKNATDVQLTGRKTFLKGLTVRKLIETEQLNHVVTSNILTKHGEQVISGPVTIEGDVFFEDNITITDSINGVPISVITDNYQVTDDRVLVKGDILFNRLAHISDLKIEGFVDDRPAQEIIDGIVYKESDFKLSGDTTFEENVTIGGNIRVIGTTNGIDLPAFVSRVVMVTKDTAVKGPVKFAEAVTIEERLTLSKDLRAEDINGIDFQSWSDRAVFVNKGYLEGNYIFEDVEIVDDLHTEYINDIDMTTLIPLRTHQNLTELTFGEITAVTDIQVGNSTNFYNLPQEFANTVMTDSDQAIDSDVDFLGNVFIEGDLELLGSLNELDVDKIVTTNTDQDLTAVYNFKSKIVADRNLIVRGLVNGINITDWFMEAVRVTDFNPQNITDNWVIPQDLVLKDTVKGNAPINGVDLKEFRQEVEDKRNYKYQVEKGFIDDYTNICKDLTYMYHKLKKQIYKVNYLETLQVLEFPNKIQNVHHFKYRDNFYLLVNEEQRCEALLFSFNSSFRFFKRVPIGPVSQIISVHDGDLIYFVVRNFDSECDVGGTNVWQLDGDNFEHLLTMDDQNLLQESMAPATFYGVKDHVVTEFKISPDLRKYRKWEVKEENMAFVPRGLATGLALRTGRKLIRLNRDDPVTDDFNYETENTIRGTFTEESNTFLPGRKSSDFVVMRVGTKSSKRSLLAVASHEETSVKGSTDFIKIYEDVIAGKVFHKLPTYKPSSLAALEFNNGETLLAFMEDESVLQVYEYKGIEGFKHKLSAKMESSRLLPMQVSDQRKILGLIDKNRVTLIEALMLGNQIEPNLQCNL